MERERGVRGRHGEVERGGRREKEKEEERRIIP